ncbi:hypothetical protein [Henriciella marina]|uniref:Uncharacterized protein n=1 Tax=Henriciella marina TaxID=453851 RepID=A0ABT4LUP4_9PROT|nr:hypothetical protein [Henriciella marina]MCZ4298076.1 hypothetical protein [Henriciella marina]
MSDETDSIKVAFDEMPNEVFFLIGVFLRNCAELEDMIETKLFSLLKLSEDQGRMLLGAATIGTKLNKLEYAAKAKDTDFHQALKRLKLDSLDEIISCRNTFAHSTYVGTMDGEFAFLTAKQMAPDNGVGTTKIETYSLDTIKERAKVSAELCFIFGNDPETQARRKERNELLQSGYNLRRVSPQQKKTPPAQKRRPQSSGE